MLLLYRLAALRAGCNWLLVTICAEAGLHHLLTKQVNNLCVRLLKQKNQRGQLHLAKHGR